jgi:hypothetical protein
LGAVFGLVRGILLAGMVLYCFLDFPLNQDLLNRSQLAPRLAGVITTGCEVLPPTLRDKLRIIKFYDYKKNNRASRSI